MRDYGKVFTTFWSSDTTRCMTEDGRTLALYLMTCPHGTIAGVFRLPDGYVCEDLQWTKERVSKGFAELFEKGFANRCETSKWVCITKFFQWNPPENPNQRKSISKVVAQVPQTCVWISDFHRENAHHWGGRHPDLSNPPATLSKPFLNQEQEQEQEQDKEKEPTVLVPEPSAQEPSEKPDRVSSCPTERLLELYHRHLPMLPRVEVMNDSRRRALSARWREVVTDKDISKTPDPRQAAIEFFDWYFEHASKSRFLTGRSKDWRADFDFLTTPSKFAKVVEGHYHKEVA